MITLITFLGKAPGAVEKIALQTNLIDEKAFGKLLGAVVKLDSNGRTGVLIDGVKRYDFEYVTAAEFLS